MKVKLKDLVTCEIDHKWSLNPQECMDFVDEYNEEPKSGGVTVMVIIDHEGKEMGFYDWVNSEGERGIQESYMCDGLEAEIELFEVERVHTVSYVRK